MSLILENLRKATPESIESAIIMLDGTQLYEKAEYKQAKAQYEKDRNIPAFVIAVIPLYEELWTKLGE